MTPSTQLTGKIKEATSGSPRCFLPSVKHRHSQQGPLHFRYQLWQLQTPLLPLGSSSTWKLLVTHPGGTHGLSLASGGRLVCQGSESSQCALHGHERVLGG